MSLTTVQLQHLENRLREERARLVGELSNFEDDESSAADGNPAGDISKFPSHVADLDSDSSQEEIETSIATRASAEIAEIDAALERLSTSPSTFGLDEETGEQIPFERLELIPYARISVHRHV